MHMHKLEKIWLIFGVSMLGVFLLVLGIGAFALGAQPPGDHDHGHHREVVNPETVEQTAPFNDLGLKKIGDNEYDAYMLAFAFGYGPENMEIPAGATVHFHITSKDVVHGFQIPGTNVNMMVVPGEVNHLTYKFTKPGEYLVLCNEYCGAAHEMMQTRILVK
ncbi:cytochrome c oxidase subunit II [Paenibacillus doosanensis]|uniref:Cytochrome aa3 subunit 2 n=1 Tax=Paenibacillus konkukensis TaxID=2020716 RepID=A0ABY4RVZ9_9BACL|nr:MULTISPECIES: cytochrome c oxidase subunit II [Paenibacillus]MCS7458886.1 cytochrome c oxidase subunit II [Paenibacillus doosanensis]UQZ86586.1 Cytochrome c oxidase subunit 2 [Paenibacillus konkukensis]